MKPMTTIARLCWPALTMALTFVLAACSAGGGSAPDEARSGSRQRAPAATDTSQTSESSESGASSESSESSESRSSSAMRSSASSGDQVEIRQPWVQVRNSPSANSGAIALAFGNDTFDVVDEEGDWVRVRIARGREGWIPRSATEAR